MAPFKPHTDCSVKKRTLQIVTEIQAMIDNDLNQVDSQIHESVWISYQAGSAWRYLVFLIKYEKEPIFITSHERREER